MQQSQAARNSGWAKLLSQLSTLENNFINFLKQSLICYKHVRTNSKCAKSLVSEVLCGMWIQWKQHFSVIFLDRRGLLVLFDWGQPCGDGLRSEVHSSTGKLLPQVFPAKQTEIKTLFHDSNQSKDVYAFYRHARSHMRHFFAKAGFCFFLTTVIAQHTPSSSMN